MDAEQFVLPEDRAWIHQSLDLYKTSMEILTDAIELYRPLDKNSFCILEDAKEVLSWESTTEVLKTWLFLLEAFVSPYLSEEDFLQMQSQVKSTCGVKGKFLFMPIRVSVIGRPHGAELKHLVPLIRVDDLIKRAKSLCA